MGREAFSFKTWKVPGRQGRVSRPPEVTTTPESCQPGFLWQPPLKDLATADWTRNKHLGEGWLVTWHEEMI